MKTTEQKLNEIEFDMTNLMMFIRQCLVKLHQRQDEYRKLQEEIYKEDGIEKLNVYANTHNGG